MKKLLFLLAKLLCVASLCYAAMRYLLSYTDRMEQKKSKYMSYYYSCNQWLKNRNNGIKLADYLLHTGIHSIAVYGMGELGARLCEELADSNVEITFIIDQGGGTFEGIANRTLEDDWEDVDMIIVTAIYDYDDILDRIHMVKPECNVISLEKLLLSAFSFEQ